jgi:DNA-binding LytR/AlgR family response regulator
MKVLIIEDEPQAVERLASLLLKLRPNCEIVGKLDAVKKSISWFRSGGLADLVLMDIQLSDGLSFEIFKEVEVLVPVVFVTAYDEYALRAFKVNSIDYILKPVDEAELKRGLDKYDLMVSKVSHPGVMLESIGNAIQMLTRKYKERFVVKVGERLKSIAITDILFFYSLEKATFCQTEEGRKHILDFTLDQIENAVDPSIYFRVNRKYIVRIDSIHDMISHVNSRVKLVLKTSDDNDIIVARERVQEFKDWLDR